jgi:hypothetical protein
MLPVLLIYHLDFRRKILCIRDTHDLVILPVDRKSVIFHQMVEAFRIRSFDDITLKRPP